MKTYKDIVQQINESENSEGGGFGLPGGDSYGRSAYSDAGIHRTESPAQLKRLNAFVNAFTQKEFLDPRSALNMLRAKLNIAGLDFQFDKSVELEENGTSFRLYRFGGTFGKSADTPIDQFEETDGFPEGKSYALNIKLIDIPNGLYKIDASISEASSFDVEADREKDSKELHSGKDEDKEEDTMESFINYKK